MVNLLGAGFVGRRYAELYPCMVNARDDLTIKTDCVLYTISTVHNYHVFVDPYLDIETNLSTLISALEHARQRDHCVFNFVSSWFVYGSGDQPFTEQSVCNPQGFYSITKRTAELLLIDYCQTFGIDYRIMRLANVLGPGDYKASVKKNVLTHLIQQIKHNQPIDLVNDGQWYRDYIHVDDVCRAIDLVINHAPPNSIWNIGNNQSTQFGWAIDYVMQRTGSTSAINSVSSSAVRSCPGINCDQLFALGYRPQWSMSQTLDQLIHNS